MERPGRLNGSELIERRYTGLVRLASNAAVAADWQQLAAAVSHGLQEPLAEGPSPGVRLWGATSNGFADLARFPADARYESVQPDELQRAAEATEPTGCAAGRMMVGLQVAGASLGVIDVDAGLVDSEFLLHCAPIVAARMSVLGGQGAGDVLLAPFALDAGADTATLMSRFASESKRLLEHDRLSAYLLTQDGRAFERFAVATSDTLRGEGVVIPFEDVGLRHIVIANRALVSEDLATDPRIVGREDRVIARAGFHGLLSVPLRRNGKPFGVLNFVSRTAGFYRDEDVPIAQQIADQVSGFIENLYVERRQRALSTHEAVERERQRLASDVYQAIAQTMPEIESVATELRDGLSGRDPDLSAKAEHVLELARMELTDVRRAIVGLAPHGLDVHSLREAVERTLASVESAGGPRTTLTIDGDPERHSAAARRAAFRILQEALTNARLHANAANVDVAIVADRDLELTVADDGIGFELAEADAGAGLGLRFMHERADRLGGTLAIETAPEEGTLVRFELLGAREALEPISSGEIAGPPGADPTYRVFVVDRHPLLRAGLIRLAERSVDMRVVGEAATIAEARRQLRRLRPDVLLLDVHLGDQLEALIDDVQTRLPGTAILVAADRGSGRESKWVELGAAGVVHKEADPDELAEAIRSVAAGSRLAPPPDRLPSGDARDTLTDRERAILALVTVGQTNSEVGAELFLATKTVERQVATIARKLGARNRAHAAAIAVARGLVDLPPGDD